MVTPDVDEVTALFHLLVRYVVNTEPTSIVEELLPVAVPVYGGEPLGRAATQRLLRATPSAETRTEAEVKETLSDALGIEALERLFGDAVETRREEIAAERHAMVRPFAQAQDRQTEGREHVPSAGWLRGIDELSPGSSDLLTITILFP